MAIAKRGQARTLRDHTYETRMRHTAELLNRHLQLKIGSHRLPDPDLQQVSYGHVLIQPPQVTTDLAQSWRSDRIPLRQRALVQRELQDLYRGNPPEVFRVLAEALRLVGPGIVLGGVAGFAMSLVIGSRMVGVEPPGPAILLGTLALQVMVVIAASFLPARKASRVDPLVALRAE